MPLTLIATPIRNPEDLTVRGLKVLQMAEVVIGEELKVTRRFLSQNHIEFKESKELYLLNEHSDSEDVKGVM